MELQSYLLKDENKGECFGRYSWKNGQDFSWLFGEKRIGLVKTPYSQKEAKYFFDDFLTTDDMLIIIPSKESPQIVRQDGLGRFTLKNINIEYDKEVNDLISLIQSQDTTHVFLSSEYENGSYPEILTFSQQAPKEELYIKSSIMPVLIVEEENVLVRKGF